MRPVELLDGWRSISRSSKGHRRQPLLTELWSAFESAWCKNIWVVSSHVKVAGGNFCGLAMREKNDRQSFTSRSQFVHRCPSCEGGPWIILDCQNISWMGDTNVVLCKYSLKLFYSLWYTFMAIANQPQLGNLADTECPLPILAISLQHSQVGHSWLFSTLRALIAINLWHC